MLKAFSVWWFLEFQRSFPKWWTRAQTTNLKVWSSIFLSYPFLKIHILYSAFAVWFIKFATPRLLTHICCITRVRLLSEKSRSTVKHNRQSEKFRLSGKSMIHSVVTRNENRSKLKKIINQIRRPLSEIVRRLWFDEGGRNSQSMLAMKVYYAPLYFGVYFTIYIGYLILKAIARHRIRIPENASNSYLLFAWICTRS